MGGLCVWSKKILPILGLCFCLGANTNCVKADNNNNEAEDLFIDPECDTSFSIIADFLDEFSEEGMGNTLHHLEKIGNVMDGIGRLKSNNIYAIELEIPVDIEPYYAIYQNINNVYESIPKYWYQGMISYNCPEGSGAIWKYIEDSDMFFPVYVGDFRNGRFNGSGLKCEKLGDTITWTVGEFYDGRIVGGSFDAYTKSNEAAISVENREYIGDDDNDRYFYGMSDVDSEKFTWKEIQDMSEWMDIYSKFNESENEQIIEQILDDADISVGRMLSCSGTVYCNTGYDEVENFGIVFDLNGCQRYVIVRSDGLSVNYTDGDMVRVTGEILGGFDDELGIPILMGYSTFKYADSIVDEESIDEETTDETWVDEREFENVFEDVDYYKGKIISLSGEVYLSTEYFDDGSGKVFGFIYDLNGKYKYILVACPLDAENFEQGEQVDVTGEIIGSPDDVYGDIIISIF